MFARFTRSSRLVGLVASLALVASVSAASAQSAASAPVAPQAPATAAQPSNMFENLSLFIGLDGSKQPQDLGINANMGARFGLNWGFQLSQSDKLGAQVGIATNLSDAAVHVLDQIEGTSRRAQVYVTAGIFQRTARRINWGLAYDMLFQDYFDTVRLGQWRGQVGYAFNDRHEMGAWVTKGVEGADAMMISTPVRLDPISQLNGYSTHTWPSNARTTVWVGFAAGHTNMVWLLPPDTESGRILTYGAELHMPLSDRFAVTGAANFLTPTASGTVDAYLGVVFYPGKQGMQRAPATFSPLQSVGNSPMFPVNVRR
jgi:hypothetical protein